MESWCKLCFDIGFKSSAVHGPVQHPRRSQFIHAQPGNEGLGAPVSERGICFQPRPTQRPPTQGFVCVAFIIDTFADKIVGWRVSSSPKTDFVLDIVEQALHDRRPVHQGGPIHHSDRDGPYLSIRYTERLVVAGIDPSVGSIGGPYDNALAETLNGLYKAEVIHRLEPWKTLAAVAWETLKWVDWFNNCRLLAPIGYIPPSEAEERYYAQFNTLDMVA